VLEDRVDSGDASVRLNTSCYNAMLSVLIRSKGKNTVLAAEQLLQRMLQREEEKGDASVISFKKSEYRYLQLNHEHFI
jgi:hypothetical protein